jgi:drug/metabolite transporter (DMT)-like permease
MLAAILTTLCFAASAILARRSATMVGSQPANLARQAAALVMLGLWAHLAGQGLRGPGLPIFIYSGVLGFGMGDFALFEALPRLGPALTVLIIQCLAVPIGAVTEWLWLGNGMTPWQIASSTAILLGVALAMAPERGSEVPRGHRISGAVFAIVGAFGQAWGAVVSRQGFVSDDQAHLHVDGATAAYQRLLGGIVCIALLAWISRIVARWRRPHAPAIHRPWRRAMPWIVGNALAGPALGVTCYQWALHVAPSAIVLSIVATTPLAVMLLAFAFEQTRPTLRTLAGSFLAVAGVVALVLSWY